jgi:hypothetical protein
MDMARDSGCLPDDRQDQFDQLRKVILEYERKSHNLIQILHMAQAISAISRRRPPMHRHRNGPADGDDPGGCLFLFILHHPTQRAPYGTGLPGNRLLFRGGKNVMDALKSQLSIRCGETTPDRRFSLEVKRCIGSCGLAPAIMIDKTVHKG